MLSYHGMRYVRTAFKSASIVTQAPGETVSSSVRLFLSVFCLFELLNKHGDDDDDDDVTQASGETVSSSVMYYCKSHSSPGSTCRSLCGGLLRHSTTEIAEVIHW